MSRRQGSKVSLGETTQLEGQKKLDLANDRTEWSEVGKCRVVNFCALILRKHRSRMFAGWKRLVVVGKPGFFG